MHIHTLFLYFFVVFFRPSTIEIFEVLMPPKVLAITTPHYKYHHDYASEIRHVQRAYIHLSLVLFDFFSNCSSSCRVEKAFDGLLKRLAKYQLFEAYTVDVKESIANAKVCDNM